MTKIKFLFHTICTIQIIHGYQMYSKLPASVNISDPSVTHLDFRTDTAQTLSPEMRQKMASAITGIEFLEEDPTIKELEQLTAKMLGKEAALFVPTATMGNLVAALVHCRDRSAELLIGDNYHIVRHEEGNLGRFGTISINAIPVLPDGTFNLTDLEDRIHYRKNGNPKICAIMTENTQNFNGGLVIPQKWLDQIVRIAKANKVPVHMDGARLFQAAVASGKKVDRITRGISSVVISLCKIGGAAGSVLVGDTKFINRARIVRNGLGGGMTQVGILAASGIYTLQNNIQRIARDQRNAKEFAKRVNDLNSSVVTVNLPMVHTNIVLIRVHPNITADDMSLRLMTVTANETAEVGEAIKLLNWPRGRQNIRITFKWEVTPEWMDKKIKKIKYVAQEYENRVKKV